MSRLFTLLAVVASIYLLLPALSNASTIAADLSRTVAGMRVVVSQAIVKNRSGQPISTELSRLATLREELSALKLLYAEHKASLEERVSSQRGNAADRQQSVSSTLPDALDDLLAALDVVIENGGTDGLQRLLDAINRLVPKRSRPLLGALPYKHSNYPPRDPAQSPVVKPAYKGGDRTVYAADIDASPDAPISKEIADLAQSFQWNPVLIYEWVKNNVDTEWYWGSMKGAGETLRQKSGNDADQAALLVALLRASNFPARYVRGTIEFFPDLNKAKNLTGLDDPIKIYTFLQKAGIPVKPVISGGTITNFQIEHIWVESFIPYSNYRGAAIDDQGKIWLGLDTSIKPQGYTRTQGAGISADILSTLRDNYLNAVQTVSPLDYLKGTLNDSLATSQPGKSWSDLKDSATLIPDILKIIPSSLQFNQIAITGEYQSLPDELIHKVAFTGTSNGNDMFSITLDAQKISNRKVALRAEPETVEDQNTIDSYGGLDNTPAYLVRLRPVLTIDGERIIVAQDGLPMGGDFSLNIDVITPNGTERITSNQIAGNLSVIGVVSQKAATPAAIADTDDAEAILHKEAIGYIDRWNKSEDDLASLLGQSVSRPTVSIATVGAQLEVTRLMDVPHDIQWKGLYLDAGYKRIECVGRNGNERDFIRLSALQGSILENRIFEDDLKADSVSTAKLLQLAKANSTPIVSIDRTNIDAILLTIPFDDTVKADIVNAVNQGLTVTIPQNEVSYLDWSGIGYIKEDPITGESGWMLSGSVAGGMTATQWANEYIVARLRAPFTPTPNQDPQSAVRIVKIPVSDLQDGVVNKPLAMPLAVLVLDGRGKPVLGAPVTFRIIDGGGNFDGNQSIPATTNQLGIAYAVPTLGKKTDGNPGYVNRPGAANTTQVGVNSVTASVSGSAGTIQLEDHFLVLAWPDVPVNIVKSLGDRNSAIANNPAGSLVARVVDQFGNPVSNVPLSFKPAAPQSRNPFVPLPADARNVTLYQPSTCVVAYPLYGDCVTQPNLTIKTDYIGAVVNTILGNSVDTSYTVRVSAPGIPATDFTLFSEGTRGATGDYIPPGLYIRSLQLVDNTGRRINAAKAGQPLAAPLVSELFLMQDSVTLAPTDGGKWHLSWSGLVTTKPVTDGNVVYKTMSGSLSATQNLQNGRYQATYITPGVPGTNFVQAYGVFNIRAPRVLTTKFVNGPSYLPGFSGMATDPNLFGTSQLTITEYPTGDLICDNTGCKLPEVMVTLQSGQQPVFFSAQPGDIRIDGIQQTTDYTVYGVTTSLTLQPKAIPVTSEGYARSDARISYTIQPLEYTPLSVDIDIYENNTYVGSVAGNNGLATIYAGTQFDITKNYTIQAVLNRGSTAEIRSEMVNLPLALGLLVPDYNHNRKIEQDDIDRAANGDTFYFWVNDDDGNGDTEGTGIPGSKDNTPNITIPGTRNLVDWFPVYLNIKPVVDKYSPSSYRYALTSASGQLKFIYSKLTSTTSGTYLTDMPTAQGLTVGAGPKINGIADFGGLANPLDPSFITSVGTSGSGVILVEAVGKSATPLVLTVYDPDNNVVFSASLNLSIDGVEQMFRHKNLIRYVKGGNGPLPDHNSKEGGEPDRFLTSNDQPSNYPDSEINNDVNLVALHGYNVDGQEARGFQSEMFKRLYWSGSRAKFWAITWYGAETKKYLANTFTLDYHTNVANAFDTAPFLKDFLNNNVKGDVTIMAHSLGNMVASSMLSDNYQSWGNNYSASLPTPKIKYYFMVDAAVAIEAYDGGATKSQDMIHKDWVNYKQSLWPSEWHQLFANDNPPDSRAKLTWRGRFKDRPANTTYYNFYSSGEEVLAALPFNTQISQILVDEAQQVGSYAWVLQEKLKGGNPIPVDIIGSSLGGWGFNFDDLEYFKTIYSELGVGTYVPISPAEANILENSILKVKPFFKKGPDPDLYLPGNTGSTYTANNMNRLLADAIPALTLPAGGNILLIEDKMDASNNFDMQEVYKNDNNDWPTIRAPYDNWKHSDFKNVSYPFVYNLFDAFVSIGGLK